MISKKKIILLMILVLIFSLSGCKNPEEKPPKVEVKLESPFLILINKENPVNKDYKPTNMISVKHYWKESQPEHRLMVNEASQSFDVLAEDAKKEGLTIECVSAYRDYIFQEALYNIYVEQHGIKEADRFSAKPGCSEHQSGLAVDISNEEMEYELRADFEETDTGRWIAENAHEYGFIIRYPKGMEVKTGYIYEPWHLRYVGKEIAKYIYKEKITLEEYLEEQ